MTTQIVSGSAIFIKDEIVIDGQIAFSTGERVVVEAVQTNPASSQNKYVVYSVSLGKPYQLSDNDISLVTDEKVESKKEIEKPEEGAEFTEVVEVQECEANLPERNQEDTASLKGWGNPKFRKNIYITVSVVAAGLIVAIIINPDILVGIIAFAVLVGWLTWSLKNRPRRVCPTCGSTRVTRFSRTWKVTKIASVGVLGLGNVHKTMHCRSCGYKW